MEKNTIFNENPVYQILKANSHFIIPAVQWPANTIGLT